MKTPAVSVPPVTLRLPIATLAGLLVLLVLTNGLEAQTPIGFGETKRDQRLIPAQDKVFTFSGILGQSVTIQMSFVSGGITPTFDLISPVGAVLKTVSGALGGTARLALFVLPTAGTYLIVCRDDNGMDTGSYNLSLVNYPGPNPSDNEGGVIISGQTKSATMVPSDMDVFTFSGTADQRVTIQMSFVSGGISPTFDLISPVETVLKTVSGALGGTARLALFVLPTAGTYLIVCRDDDGMDTGSYNLSLTVLNVADSDNDGLQDTWEREYFSDLRYGPDDDPDEDRLKNRDELSEKTNPNKPDTDDDGFKDGTEVALGSDPLDASSKPTTGLRITVKTVDIEFITIAGSRYQLQASRDFKTWDNLGDPIQGDNSLFRTNIDVRGTDYKWFIAPATTP